MSEEVDPYAVHYKQNADGRYISLNNGVILGDVSLSGPHGLGGAAQGIPSGIFSYCNRSVSDVSTTPQAF